MFDSDVLCNCLHLRDVFGFTAALLIVVCAGHSIYSGASTLSIATPHTGKLSCGPFISAVYQGYG